MPARARFDDLASGTAWAFDHVVRELVAWRANEVVSVLDEAQRLSDDGRWAFGFVAYEAAPGLDPGLTTAAPDPDLPLAWFGHLRGTDTRTGRHIRRAVAIFDRTVDSGVDRTAVRPRAGPRPPRTTLRWRA